MVTLKKCKLLAITLLPILFVPVPDAHADCGRIPYSIELKELGGEIRIALAKRAQSALTLGGSAINAAYNGMLSQAIGETLDFYGCRIKEQIQASNLPDEDKLAQTDEVDKAVSDFGITLSAYQDLFAKSSPQQVLAEGERIMEMKRRPGSGIDVAFFDKAIGEPVIPIKKTFLEKKIVQGWLSATIPAGALTACGGVVLAAVDSNIDSIQRAVADIRVPFRQYLDRRQAGGFANAKAKLLSLARLQPIAPSNAEEASAFQGCAQAAMTSTSASDAADIVKGGPRPAAQAGPSTNGGDE